MTGWHMAGWHMAGTHPRQYEHGLAKDMSYEGKPVAHLRCSVERADGFGTLMQTIAAERFLDNMADRPVRGTMDWQRYEVVLDVPAEAQAIAFGILLPGEGEAWMSDLDLETVGSETETTDSAPDPLPDSPQNLDFSEL